MGDICFASSPRLQAVRTVPSIAERSALCLLRLRPRLARHLLPDSAMTMKVSERRSEVAKN
jgi:hypothetical protein